MIRFNQPYDEPDAESALRMAETRATSAYAFAFALCPDLLGPLGPVRDQHREASRRAPGEASGHPAPPLKAWQRAEMRVRLLSSPATASALTVILLRAEEQWLRSLHRWILTGIDGPDRPPLCQALLIRQWHNRNRVLAWSQELEVDVWSY